MGLEQLAREIGEDAKKRVKELEKEANAEEKQVIEEAEARRDAILAEARERVKQTIDELRRERIASARLEARKIISRGQEEAVDEALKRVKEKLKDIREQKTYPTLLKKLIKEAADEVDHPVVAVNKEDQSAAKKIRGVKLAPEPIECIGGAVVYSKDGRVCVENTLESMFEESRESMRQEVYGILFEK